MDYSFTCPICRSGYFFKDPNRPKGSRVPRILNCSHTACEGCLTKLAKELKEEIVCPICKKPTPVTNNVHDLILDRYAVGQMFAKKQAQMEQLEAQLKPFLSYKPAGMVKQSTSNTGKKRPPKLKLTPKERCNECNRSEATCKCLKCDCSMCASCFDTVHNSSKILRKHQAVPIDCLQGDGQATPVTCADHDNRPIEYYCEDDKSSICSYCVINGPHKGHAIVPMEERNKDALNELEPTKNNAVQATYRMRTSYKTLNDAGVEIKNDMKKMVEEIREKFHTLHSVLLLSEAAQIKQIQWMFQKEVDAVDGMKAELEEGHRTADQAIKESKKILSEDVRFLLNAKHVLEKLKKTVDHPSVLLPMEHHDPLRFEYDEEVYEKLSGCVKLLGKPNGRYSLQRASDIPESMLEFHPVEDYESDTSSLVSGSSEPNTPQMDWDARVSLEQGEHQSHRKSSSTASGLSNGYPPSIQDIMSIQSETSDTSSTSDLLHRRKSLKKPKIDMVRPNMVHVTHIKSPASFVVQKQSDSNRMQVLTNVVNKWGESAEAAKAVPESVEIDDLVLCKYSKDDTWYRGRVLSIYPPSAGQGEGGPLRYKILYVDYGNWEVVTQDRLRTLIPKFMKLPELAIHCGLFDLVPPDDGDWSGDAAQQFANMTGNCAMVMNVVGQEKDKYIVDLSKPGDDNIDDDRPLSVRDAFIFLELGVFSTVINGAQVEAAKSARPLKQYLTQAPMRPGEEFQGILVYIENPSSFYIQKVGQEVRYLTSMMDQLEEVYSKEKSDAWTIYCPLKDMICVCQFAVDKRWYRAKILSLPGARMVDVQYVDFGNCERTSYFQLRKIQKQFLKLPPQALRCSLADVEPPCDENEWSDKANDVLGDYLSKPLVAHVTKPGDDTVYINLYDPDARMSINSRLVMEGLAESLSERADIPSNTNIPVRERSLLDPSEAREIIEANEGIIGANEGIIGANEGIIAANEGIIEAKEEILLQPQPSSPPRPPVEDPGGEEVNSAVSSPARPKTSIGPGSLGSPVRPTGPVKAHTKTVDKPRMSEVVVSHVISPGQIFVQLSSAGVDGLDELMDEMKATYEGSDVTTIGWQAGDTCSARCDDDGRWYRAKIVSSDSESSAKVMMMDFGFTITVPRENLRPLLLNKDKEQNPCFAIKCHLANIQPAGDISKWSSTACEYLDEILDDEPCHLVVKGTSTSNQKSLPIDLLLEEIVRGDALTPDYVNCKSVSRMLIDKGLALPIRRRAIVKDGTQLSPEPIPPVTEASSNSSKIRFPPKEPTLSFRNVSQASMKSPVNLPDKSSVQQQSVAGKKDDADPKLAPEMPEDPYPNDDKSSALQDKQKETESNEEVAADVDDDTKVAQTEEPATMKELADDDGSSVDPPISNPSTPDVRRSISIEPARESPQKNEPSTQFPPPETPESMSLRVVPTYVDYDCIIYAQEIKDVEHQEGRYGFILKETTLEVTIQNQHLEKYGLRRALIPRDGNCLFSVFAQGIFGNLKQHLEIREAVVNTLRENWSSFENVVADLDKEDYLSELSRPNSYGGELEIHVMCWLYNTRAEVFLGGLNHPVKVREYGLLSPERDPIQLIYVSDGIHDSGHYDLVLKQSPPRELVKAYQEWRSQWLDIFKSEQAIHDDTVYDDSILEQLQTRLHSYYENTEPDNTIEWQVGQICVSRYSDGTWYRSKIVDRDPEKGFKVFYVDFGDSNFVQQVDLRKVTMLADIPQQCYECQLVGIKPKTLEGKWPIPVLDQIHNIVVGKMCLLTLMDSPVYGQRLKVNLFVSNQTEENLAELMCTLGYSIREWEIYEPEQELDQLMRNEGLPDSDNDPVTDMSEKESLVEDSGIEVSEVSPTGISFTRKWASPFKIAELSDVGDRELVTVTQLDSPNQIYCQRAEVETNEQLQQMLRIMNEMSTEVENYLPISEPSLGMPCCAQFTFDDCWYRAEVVKLHNSEDQVGVLYSDYGNSEIIPISRLRELPEKFQTLPAQGIPCLVENLFPPGAEWGSDAFVAFTQLYQTNQVLLHVKALGNPLVVELYANPTLDQPPDLLLYSELVNSGYAQLCDPDQQ